MNRLLLISVLLLLICVAGPASAETWVYTSSFSVSKCDYGGYWDYEEHCGASWESLTNVYLLAGVYHHSHSVSASFDKAGCEFCNHTCAAGMGGTYARTSTLFAISRICSYDGGGSRSTSGTTNLGSNAWLNPKIYPYLPWTQGNCCPCSGSGTIIVSNDTIFTVSGTTTCADLTELYILDGGSYYYIDSTDASSYSFDIFMGLSYRLLFDGEYYDFTCDGDEVFDYDACIYVYGYTCGVDAVKLYKDDGGWVLDDSAGQTTGYDVYEMQIVDGEDYKISFIDSGTVVHNQTFYCTGDHVLIDFDRCQWIYPPNGLDLPIYLWSGYAYNVVVFKDTHGNMVENAELAVYDNTDNTYIQRWTGNSEGYALLGTKFDTDHDVLMMLRTFDGVFTLATTFPANGSAVVGEEDIATTNWTIPIKYNLNVLPVDQYGVSLFDVFCGLSEYTPLNPGAFWGMDLSDQGYVAVTNCSGFAMCDIIAEKEGYTDYRVEALNWTSKSALVKDYRHNVVMEEE